MANGRQLAVKNAERFHEWVAERDKAADWVDYVVRGKISRTEIALECGFAKSALVQNPAIRQALAELEQRLQSTSVISIDTNKQRNGSCSEGDANAEEAVNRLIATVGKTEANRINYFEQVNAALREEVAHLKEKLRRYEYIERHLVDTGRMLVP
jgi:hypothetical protein